MHDSQSANLSTSHNLLIQNAKENCCAFNFALASEWHPLHQNDLNANDLTKKSCKNSNWLLLYKKLFIDAVSSDPYPD